MRQPPHAVGTVYLNVLIEVMECVKYVMVAANVMFLNRLPFIVSVGRGIN